MVMLSEAIPNRMEIKLETPSNGELGKPKPHALTQNSPQKHNSNEKRQLLAALSKVCALQKNYGKTAAELEILVDGFLWVLADYPMADILQALAEYIKRNPDIPAPADIVNIIDPVKAEWKPDWPVYIALKKRIQRDGYYVYGSEKKFLQRCDDYAIEHATAATEPVSDDERMGRQIAIGEKTFFLEGPDA